MQEQSSITQGLPLITIILALLFFIILRVVSRFRKQAHAEAGSTNLSHLQYDFKTEKDPPDRIQLKCPAFIDKPEGIMKVGIKELTTSGAFVTCPNPFPIGESFPLKIMIDDRASQTFKAEVVWNNRNVLEEEIVTRGMKVRFLQLSQADRKMLGEIISLRAIPRAFV